MFYVPTANSTLTTPVVVQAPNFVPLTSSYVLPTAPVIYPHYGFVPTSLETTAKAEKNQTEKPVHHVMHYHFDYQMPQKVSETTKETRPSTPPSPTVEKRSIYHHRISERSPQDDYTLSETTGTYGETIDDQIRRVREELRNNYIDKRDQSTETVDFYHPLMPPRTKTPEIPYKQHYDAPKPRGIRPIRSRSAERRSLSSRPQSVSINTNNYNWSDSHTSYYRPSSSNLKTSQNVQWETTTGQKTVGFADPIHKKTVEYVTTGYEDPVKYVDPDYIMTVDYDSSKFRGIRSIRSRSAERRSLSPRPPWKPTNQNDYNWRDSHIGYYRPSSTASVQNSRSVQTESTTKYKTVSFANPVQQETVKYITPCCADRVKYVYPVCSTTVKYEVPVCSTAIDFHHRPVGTSTSTKPVVYRSKGEAVHIIPKQGTTYKTPYLKIHNAPVTYLH